MPTMFAQQLPEYGSIRESEVQIHLSNLGLNVGLSNVQAIGKLKGTSVITVVN